MNSIKSLIAACGMTQRAFAEYFHVPLRSVENWTSGSRQCPEYVAELIEYKAEREGLIIQRDQLQIDLCVSEHSEEYPSTSEAIVARRL